ncbi:MAG: NAD(P)H-hydrate epimerase, partial [Calditrichaeota bacterium]
FWAQSKIVVLAGTGGNGGGGICAARHLANRHLKVKLCVTSKERLKEVPRWQYQIFRNTSGMDIGPEELKKESPDLILDALIGYSLNGAPTGLPADLISWANEQTCPILSLDVPSGVDASTGETPGVYIKATWTLTLALPKTGLVREKCGQLFLADLGIPAGVYAKCGISYIPPFGNRFWVPLDWA